MYESLNQRQPQRKTSGVFVGILLALLMVFTIFQTIKAQEGIRGQELQPADLSGSQKVVNNGNITPGGVIQYSIIINNSGDQPAAEVTMTDTLTTGLTYQADSLQVTGGGLFGEENGTITWTGAVNNNAEVVVSFNAVVDGDYGEGEAITNTAEIAFNGSVLERTVVTYISVDTISYLPIVGNSIPIPGIFLNPIGRPNSSNTWNVTWSVTSETYVTEYELQEAFNEVFVGAETTIIPAGTNNLVVNKLLSLNNLYYYRVRAIGGFGETPWSNIQQVRGGYRDDFNFDTSGWTMRRQDTDTVINDSFYREGHLVLEMDSSYDYQIVSSLAPAPAPPYQLEARIRLVGVDNLHSYGMIFGGDWNGQQCPVDDYSTCFNHYYRLNVLWSGNLDDRLTVNLKRIDYHEAPENSGRGVDLMTWRTVDVNPPSQGWQTWTFKVYANGVIRLFLNGEQIYEAFDTNYINDPYFGAFSSTDEYNGLEAEFEYFEAAFLD